MKLNEHQEQVMLIKWFRLQYPKLTIFSIPNAAKRSMQLAAYMKAEGLISGVPDLFLMKANKTRYGLFIEMKAKDGKPTESQIEFIEKAKSQNYEAVIAYGYEEAKNIINEYLQN